MRQFSQGLWSAFIFLFIIAVNGRPAVERNTVSLGASGPDPIDRLDRYSVPNCRSRVLSPSISLQLTDQQMPSKLPFKQTNADQRPAVDE